MRKSKPLNSDYMRNSLNKQNLPGPLRNNAYPPVPKMVIDDTRDPLLLKKSDINIKKAL